MRMSGFLFGGIVGAAAALYFSRNNRPMMLTNVNWDQAVDKAGQFVRSAKTMWDTATAIAPSVVSASSDTSSDTSHANGKSGAGLDKVEDIIKHDAALKQQVDEILMDSGRTPVHTQ